MGIKRRAVSATAEMLAGFSAPAHQAASALGRAALCRASSLAALAAAPARGENPVKGRMNRLADFSMSGPCYIRKRTHSSAIPGNSPRSSSGQQRGASVSGCRVGSCRTGPAGPQKQGGSGKQPRGGGSKGRSGGGRIASPEAQQSAHGFLSRSSYTPPVAHLSPDTAMC